MITIEDLEDDLIHGRCRFCGKKTHNGTDICNSCREAITLNEFNI